MRERPRRDTPTYTIRLVGVFQPQEFVNDADDDVTITPLPPRYCHDIPAAYTTTPSLRRHDCRYTIIVRTMPSRRVSPTIIIPRYYVHVETLNHCFTSATPMPQPKVYADYYAATIAPMAQDEVVSLQRAFKTWLMPPCQDILARQCQIDYMTAYLSAVEATLCAQICARRERWLFGAAMVTAFMSLMRTMLIVERCLPTSAYDATILTPSSLFCRTARRCVDIARAEH